MMSTVKIDISRDVCVTENYDHSGLKDVSVELILNPGPEKNIDTDTKRKWLKRTRELIEAHNTTYRGGKSSFLASPPAQPYSMGMGRGLSQLMLNGIVCKDMDGNKCRNRNFRFYKNGSPEQLAEIVFRNTIREHPEMPMCQS
jgi:hypothetical protein